MIQFPLWLASASPRRRQLLEDAGFEVRIEPSDLDDGGLRPGDVSPEAWVMTLAHFKARRVADRLTRGKRKDPAAVVGGTVIGADTMCEFNGALLGQPRDAEHARAMLQAMRNNEHRTMTGVCLIDLASSGRQFFVDVATVHIGDLSDATVEAYVESGEWRGKAGAYNLAERIDAGWPITCGGDPTTVMGLPMRRLLPLLQGDRKSTA